MAMQKDENWLACITTGVHEYEAGDYRAAEKALRANLKNLKKQVDVRSDLNVQLTRMLANSCREQDRFKESDALYEQALSSMRNDRGVGWNQLRVLRDYALSLILQGRFDAAYNVERKALQLAEAAADIHKFEVNTSLARLCALSRCNLDYENAERHYLACLKLRESALEADDPQLRPLLADLGLVCFRLGKYAQSEQFNLRALRSAVQNADMDECSELYRRLGLSLCAQEKHMDGQAACSRSCESKNSSRCDVDCINQLADVYCGQERWDAARKLCEDALSASEFGAVSSGDALADKLEFYVRTMRRLNFCEKMDRIERRIGELKGGAAAA